MIQNDSLINVNLNSQQVSFQQENENKVYRYSSTVDFIDSSGQAKKMSVVISSAKQLSSEEISLQAQQAQKLALIFKLGVASENPNKATTKKLTLDASGKIIRTLERGSGEESKPKEYENIDAYAQRYMQKQNKSKDIKNEKQKLVEEYKSLAAEKSLNEQLNTTPVTPHSAHSSPYSSSPTPTKETRKLQEKKQKSLCEKGELLVNEYNNFENFQSGTDDSVVEELSSEEESVEGSFKKNVSNKEQSRLFTSTIKAIGDALLWVKKILPNHRSSEKQSQEPEKQYEGSSDRVGSQLVSLDEDDDEKEKEQKFAPCEKKTEEGPVIELNFSSYE